MEQAAIGIFGVLAGAVGFLPERLAPYISLMLAGFFVGALGHITRSRWLVASGILLVFLATFLFPLVLLAGEENPPEAPDPRLREMPGR